MRLLRNTPSSRPAALNCTTAADTTTATGLAKDAAAWAAFDIFGVHEYDSQVALRVAGRRQRRQAEQGGLADRDVRREVVAGRGAVSSDINNGVAVAGWIHSALTDRRGVGLALVVVRELHQNDNEGLARPRAAPITKRHFTLGNYSKFVRPGYVRGGRLGNSNASVLLSAYKGTDGTVVVVAINKGTRRSAVPITIAGGTAPALMTPWVTSATDNLIAKTAVPVSGGSFTAALAATTVTTFVGK